MSADLAKDIKNANWMTKRIIQSDTYAQNLYAALCNNRFQRRDIIDILTGQTWSCSWRYAGGIIAEVRNSGDYLDWYCSGAGGIWQNAQQLDVPTFMPEGTVTRAIRSDLGKLGWSVLD